MRVALGTLLLAAALTGCGSDETSTVEAPEEPGWRQVALLTASDAGGEVTSTATALPDEEAGAAFAAGLDERLGSQVVDAAASVDVPEDQQLYGAVVALGCEPPTDVAVTRSGDDVVVEPVVTGKPEEIQCLVPVTTVVLVLA